MNVRPRIHVTIDALELRGFAQEQQRAVAAGLRHELERLLAAADPAAFGDSRHVENLAHAKLPIAADAEPRRIGSLAAKRIARGVMR